MNDGMLPELLKEKDVWYAAEIRGDNKGCWGRRYSAEYLLRVITTCERALMRLNIDQQSIRAFYINEEGAVIVAGLSWLSMSLIIGLAA